MLLGFVFALGLFQCAGVPPMDEILKKIGYSKGSVGERMQALAKDRRYQFSEKSIKSLQKTEAMFLCWIRQKPGK